jgi:hypothetical protein
MSSALLLEAARATAAPRAPASPLAHFFQINRTRGLVAGALLGAGAAFLAWGYQTWPENEGSAHENGAAADSRAATTEITAEGRLRSSAVGSSTSGAATSGSATSGAGRPGSSSASRSTARIAAHAAAEELPVILQTDDLPRAPDDGFEDDEGGGAESGSVARSGGMAGAHSGSKHAAPASATLRTAKSDPKPENARPEPPVRAAVAKPTATPRRETASHNAKHTSASADCNPPYFFDNNNIRRLKLECL